MEKPKNLDKIHENLKRDFKKISASIWRSQTQSCKKHMPLPRQHATDESMYVPKVLTLLDFEVTKQYLLKCVNNIVLQCKLYTDFRRWF